MRRLGERPCAVCYLCVAWFLFLCMAPFSAQANNVDDNETPGRVVLPAGVRVLRDVSYGNDTLQRMDVYLPRQVTSAPVILMVHGGAWRLGDKEESAVVENKVARWVPKGFIFISANYRLLPKADPLEQAQDIARALAAAQNKASGWGGDPEKFILMGHSAGAHLVALLTANPSLAYRQGAKPWLGTVALDSAAYDVVLLMGARHARFYDRAFTDDPLYWKKVSPFHVLSASARPFLAVCSSRAKDSCPQASRFVARAAELKVRASFLTRDLTHSDINHLLGVAGGYTEAVEAFMRTLDTVVAKAFQ